MNHLKSISIAMMWCVCFVSSCKAQSGVIHGTIIDEKGLPVSGANVVANKAGTSDVIGPSVQSDATGIFTIPNLPWGKYTITAEKLESGYPKTPSKFYGSPSSPPVLEISPEHPSANTKDAFRGKASVIMGTVIDDEASTPVAATFLLRYEKDPGNFLSVEEPSNYRILVPGDVSVMMEISAQGYKTWYYPGTNDYAKKTSFRLKAGQTLKINIRLDGDGEDCACLDRPQRWGLGADSPAFQWHDLQDEIHQQTCSRTSHTLTAHSLQLTVSAE